MSTRLWDQAVTIPATGALSMSQIQTEFGGANPISIHEYYGVASGVPASGTIAMSSFRGKSSTPVYAFTPVYSYTSGGTAVANGGLPADYNASIHGSIIWPASQGLGGAGWLGTTFTATTATTYFQFGSDNTVAVYLGTSTGTTLIASGGDWHYWSTASVATTPGKKYTISLYVTDAGSAYGTVGRVYDSNGTNIVVTNSAWMST